MTTPREAVRNGNRGTLPTTDDRGRSEAMTSATERSRPYTSRNPSARHAASPLPRPEQISRTPVRRSHRCAPRLRRRRRNFWRSCSGVSNRWYATSHAVASVTAEGGGQKWAPASRGTDILTRAMWVKEARRPAAQGGSLTPGDDLPRVFTNEFKAMLQERETGPMPRLTRSYLLDAESILTDFTPR